MADRGLQEYLLRDLYTYASEGVGFNLYEEPHRHMCQEFEDHLPPWHPSSEDDQTYFGYGAPRETLKTSIGVQSVAEYYALKARYVYGYDARILIVRAAREDSATVLSAIREDLSGSNPVLYRAFGDLSHDSPLWTTEGATFNCREISYREPTFSTASIGVSRTGYHYDLVLLDDLTNESNYLSIPVMGQAYRYIQALLPVLNSWGSMFHVGTRWPNDTFGFLYGLNDRADQEGKPKPWAISMYGAWKPDGNLFYPAHLTEKRLEQKRATMDRQMFASQYLNQILAEESKIFSMDQIRYYDADYTAKSDNWDIAQYNVTEGRHANETFNVSCAIHVDPATSISEQANFTGIAVVMTDGEKRRWIHEAVKNKEPSSATLARLVRLARTYRPDTISIDVLGQQVLWVDPLKDALQAADLGYINITQYKGKDGKIARGILGKDRRIEQGLEPLVRAGQVYFRKGACTPLLQEMSYYQGVTKANHYDLLDALSHTCTVYSLPKDEIIIQKELSDWEYEFEFGDESRTPKIVKGAWAGR